MISQYGAALGVTPIPGSSAIMNYSSRATFGKYKSDGKAGLNSHPFSILVVTATGYCRA